MAEPLIPTPNAEPTPVDPAPADPTPSDPPTYEAPQLEEFMGGKFHTFEAVQKSYAAQQEEAKRLKDQLGGFTGPPVDEQGNAQPYAFELPEGVEGELLPTDDPIMQKLTEIGQKHRMSQETAQELFSEALVPWMQSVVSVDAEAEQAALVERFGSAEVANEKLQGLSNWLYTMNGGEMADGKPANAELVETIQAALCTADSIAIMATAMERAQSMAVPTGDPAPATSKDDLRERYFKLKQSDPSVNQDETRKAREAYLESTGWPEDQAKSTL